jgi:hypothetical protein
VLLLLPSRGHSAPVLAVPPVVYEKSESWKLHGRRDRVTRQACERDRGSGLRLRENAPFNLSSTAPPGNASAKSKQRGSILSDYPPLKVARQDKEEKHFFESNLLIRERIFPTGYGPRLQSA